MGLIFETQSAVDPFTVRWHLHLPFSRLVPFYSFISMLKTFSILQASYQTLLPNVHGDISSKIAPGSKQPTTTVPEPTGES